MAQNDVEKALATFTAKLKHIEPGSITEAGSIKGEMPPEAPAPPTPLASAAESAACLNKGFRDMVGALEEKYIGVDIKDLVVTFLEELPVCS